MVVAVVATAATKPSGGAWPNLARTPPRLALVVVLVAAGLASRHWYRSRRRTAATAS
jgi:hypothetical protein